jgi:creatinine amidohydrolase
MPGKILKLEELSSPQVKALNPDATAFFCAISPIEGHGPHLPLGVDYFDAIYFAEIVSRLLIKQHPEFDVVIAPPMPLGTQVYRHPGSIRVDARSLYRVVYEFGDSLANFGFKYILLLSGHGAPKQIVALETASVQISKKYNIQMHSLSGVLAIRFLKGEFIEQISAIMNRKLTDEEKSLLKKDIHGGWWETSMMLLLRPDLVDQGYKTLETVTRTEKNQPPVTGYFGAPSYADKEFAEASLKVMTEEISGTIGRIIDGKNERSETVSQLYGIPMLRPFWSLYWLWGGIIVVVLALLALALFR